MKKYKGYIIFIVVLAIYGVLLFVIFGNKQSNNNTSNNENNTINNQTDNNDEKKYLVIGNISNLSYINNKFYGVKSNEIEKLDKLKTYVNNKYYGDYKFKMGKNWNLFDKNNEFINYNGNLIAYSDNFNIKVRSKYKIREINEKEKVFLINNYNLSSFANLITNEVADIDLDNNGVEDQIICLSFMDENDNIKNNYRIVVIKLNNEKITLIDERNEDAKNIYSIYGIINIDNNKYDSIIITKTEGYITQDPKMSSLIYNYKNDKYVID